MKDIVNIINTSRRPLLLVGSGIIHSASEALLNSFSRKNIIPIIASAHAKSLIKHKNPFHIGCIGFGASKAGLAFIDHYQPDLLIVLGSRLSETSTANWSEKLSGIDKIIHVDDDASVFNRSFENTINLKMDLKGFLNQMNRSNLEVIDRIIRQHAIEKFDFSLDSSFSFLRNPNKLHPLAFIEWCNNNLPNDAIIISELGNSTVWLVHYLNVKEGQQFYVPLSFGAMGNSIGAAIGAKIAQPDREVILVSGDAAMMMGGLELFTAQQLSLDIKVFVLNDGGHGMVDHGQKMLKNTNGNVRYNQKVDFSCLAEGFCAYGETIGNEEDLKSLDLNTNIIPKGVRIFDLNIDAEVTPPIGDRAKLLGHGDEIES